MPVYNGGDYLKSAIKSILDQTYRDFEFLIINDCSTDNSLDTIRSFNDPRILVHTNEVNMGQTKSLNVGLRLARGKYVVINDADDLSLPQRIEKQLDFIQKHPEYPVVGTSCFIIDRFGKIKRIFRRPTDSREILLQILSDTPLTHGSVIMEKDVILSQGGYNEDFRICQDYELWSSLIRRGYRVANIPDMMVMIRTYADSISFKERDAQTIENGKTLLANVKSMTNLDISLDEAVRQRLFFVAPEKLTDDDFEKAEKLFIGEYKNLNSLKELGMAYTEKDLGKRLVKPYAKLALARFIEGSIGDTRKIARRYLNRNGNNHLILLIWLLSYTGRRYLNAVLSIHGKSQAISSALSQLFYPVKGK
jgi:glycosyltransferase involved in cell wall biosynthesis